MLILNRRQDQKVCFPGLGVSVQVLRVKGSSVRLGIDAPPNVRVLRDELAERNEPLPGDHVAPQRESRQPLQDELGAVSIALQLFKKEMEAGLYAEAEATYQKLNAQLERLSQAPFPARPADRPIRDEQAPALLVEDKRGANGWLADPLNPDVSTGECPAGPVA